MYAEKNPWISTDDARGRQGSVPGRPLRPSPSCLKQRAPFPSYARTDGDSPSRPVPRNFGRTGRLRTLLENAPFQKHGDRMLQNLGTFGSISTVTSRKGIQSKALELSKRHENESQHLRVPFLR